MISQACKHIFCHFINNLEKKYISWSVSIQGVLKKCVYMLIKVVLYHVYIIIWSCLEFQPWFLR